MSSLPAPFRCDVDVPANGGPTRVTPVGELDLATAPTVEATVAEQRALGAEHFVLDLREVTFMDSSGLRLVLALHKADPELVLIAGPPAVQRVFDATGVTDRLRWIAPG